MCAGTTLIRTEGRRCRPDCDFLLDRPQHSIDVVGILRHIGKGIDRSGRGITGCSPQERHNMCARAGQLRAEGCCARANGNLVLRSPQDSLVIVAALRHIHECVGRGSTGDSGGGGVTKYAVAVSPADNGKVTPDKTRAAKDSVVTITTKVNDGYALDTIKATDKAGKEIKLTDKGDGKYTFTMPASKVEVKAAFKQTASKPG